MTNSKINRLQQWALSYHLNLLSKEKWDDRDEMVKIEARINNPELYQKVFVEQEMSAEESSLTVPEEFNDLGDGSGDAVVSTNELDEEMLDFLKSLEVPHQINAGKTNEDGWL